jgi:hypothetical protein
MIHFTIKGQLPALNDVLGTAAKTQDAIFAT